MSEQDVYWGVFRWRDGCIVHVLPCDANGAPIMGHKPSRECFCQPTEPKGDGVLIHQMET